MRFLLVMLTVVWLLFGWVCYDSIRWREPLEIPWHAAGALEEEKRRTERFGLPVEEFIERETIRWTVVINDPNVDAMTLSKAHYQLARYYWLDTYLERSYIKQTGYLKKSLNELKSALYYLYSARTQLKIANLNEPDEVVYLYSIADIYHQLKDYVEAEKYYLKALRMSPVLDPRIYRRYNEMLAESGFESKFSP